MRVVVVGLGWAGRRQLEAMALIDGIEVVSVVDTDRHRARGISEEFGTVSRPTLDEALSEDCPQMVSICTPHATHRELTDRVARAGVHVLVEKPMAMSVDDASEMIEVADRHNVALGVAEHQVYEELTRLVAGVLASGSLGDVVSVSAVWGFSAPDFGYEGRRAWLTDPRRGGTGTWMLHGVHRVAQLRSLFGEIVDIRAVGSSGSRFRRPDLVATVSALMRTEDGVAISLVQSSELLAGPEHQGLAVYCENGVIRARPDGVTVKQEGHRERTWELVEGEIQPYVREIEAFVTHLESGCRFPTDGRSEIRTLVVVEAGSQSMRTGQVVLTPAPARVFGRNPPI